MENTPNQILLTGLDEFAKQCQSMGEMVLCPDFSEMYCLIGDLFFVCAHFNVLFSPFLLCMNILDRSEGAYRHEVEKRLGGIGGFFVLAPGGAGPLIAHLLFHVKDKITGIFFFFNFAGVDGRGDDAIEATTGASG